MTRQIIAVDIDDVLADTTDTLRLFVNDKFGVDLGKHHYRVKAEYWGYYETVWSKHGIQASGVLDEFHAKYTLNQMDAKPVYGAKKAISMLSSKYTLVAVSSRAVDQQLETERWLKHVFGDVFKTVLCIDTRKTGLEKGETCHQLGARFLIDDNVDHCDSAIRAGLTAVLFGLYGWQHEDKISEKIVRCPSWGLVSEYFNGTS